MFYYKQILCFFFKWLGAMNIRSVVEKYISRTDGKLIDTKHEKELDKKIEKLLLTGKNKDNTKKEM